MLMTNGNIMLILPPVATKLAQKTHWILFLSFEHKLL